jgi:hypothetical protein
LHLRVPPLRARIPARRSRISRARSCAPRATRRSTSRTPTRRGRSRHTFRIGECATAQQIESELVANFGAGILAAPPHKGFDLLAWWLPLGGVIAGAGLLALGVWRWSRRREPEASAPIDAATEQRIDELLADLD